MDIISFDKAKQHTTCNKPHNVAEVICLKCLHRWIAVYPTETLLKELECPCGEIGYVIKTGQEVI